MGEGCRHSQICGGEMLECNMTKRRQGKETLRPCCKVRYSCTRVQWTKLPYCISMKLVERDFGGACLRPQARLPHLSCPSTPIGIGPLGLLSPFRGMRFCFGGPEIADGSPLAFLCYVSWPVRSPRSRQRISPRRYRMVFSTSLIHSGGLGLVQRSHRHRPECDTSRQPPFGAHRERRDNPT
jgi:hypothetical protein